MTLRFCSASHSNRQTQTWHKSRRKPAIIQHRVETDMLPWWLLVVEGAYLNYFPLESAEQEAVPSPSPGGGREAPRRHSDQRMAQLFISNSASVGHHLLYSSTPSSLKGLISFISTYFHMSSVSATDFLVLLRKTKQTVCQGFTIRKCFILITFKMSKSLSRVFSFFQNKQYLYLHCNARNLPLIWHLLQHSCCMCLLTLQQPLQTGWKHINGALIA